MKRDLHIPEEWLSELDKDDVVEKEGAITQLCDFSDNESSTAFFTADDDPNWYGWLGLTPTMHSTALKALDYRKYGAWVMVDMNGFQLLRLIVYAR